MRGGEENEEEKYKEKFNIKYFWKASKDQSKQF